MTKFASNGGKKKTYSTALQSQQNLSLLCCIFQQPSPARGCRVGGTWPEPGSSTGTVAISLCHPALDESGAFPQSLTFHPRPFAWPSQTAVSPASRALGLPESQIYLNLGTPGVPHPSPSILMLQQILCDSAGILCGSGKSASALRILFKPSLSHWVQYFQCSIPGAGIVLSAGLISARCPSLSPRSLPSVLSWVFLPFPRQHKGFKDCGVVYLALRCCRPELSLLAFPRL